MSSVNIEILVGGRRVGTLEVGSTGGWNNYRELSTNISNVTSSSAIDDIYKSDLVKNGETLKVLIPTLLLTYDIS
jgi:hypothetical protein